MERKGSVKFYTQIFRNFNCGSGTELDRFDVLNKRILVLSLLYLRWLFSIQQMILAKQFLKLSSDPKEPLSKDRVNCVSSAYDVISIPVEAIR